jgi:hypothetical protein
MSRQPAVKFENTVRPGQNALPRSALTKLTRESILPGRPVCKRILPPYFAPVPRYAARTFSFFRSSWPVPLIVIVPFSMT